MQIEGRILWKATFDPDSSTWIGTCDELNLNAIGDTWAEFQECASEALGLLFADLLADGELGAFLARHHWTANAPLPEHGQEARFDVPFDVTRTPAREFALA